MIELKGIYKWINTGNNRTFLLRDINLSVKEGEFISIMGPSGSGKSTLIRALTRLGAHVTLCGPSTLVPRVFERMGCRVTYNVDEAIESHRGASCRHHCHDYPENLPPFERRLLPRQQRAGQRERQRKHRMAEADEGQVGLELVHGSEVQRFKD